MPLWKVTKPSFLNGLFFTSILLSLLGIMFIYSSEVSVQQKNLFYLKQLISVFLAVGVYIILTRVDYHYFANLHFPIYFGGILLLIVVLIFGVRVNGAKSWINLGFYNAQLAEFSKVAFMISLAYFFSRYQEYIKNKSFFLLALLFCAPYIFFLILQPDFGTAVIFLFIFLTMFFVAGGDIGIILFCLPIFILSILIPFAGFYFRTYSQNSSLILLDLSLKQMLFIGGFFLVLTFIILIIHSFLARKGSLFLLLSVLIVSLSFFGAGVFKSFLKEYHYERILVTLKPDLDPERKGYNLNQSLISIGGGKFAGYGFTKGPQNRGHFLPANHTDFIIAVIAEEWGFLGIILVIILNVILIYQLFKIASDIRDRFGFFIIAGISGLFISHFLINILSVTGFLPIIGIPLPFLSYGGSFMMSSFICLGIATNIKRSRYRFKEFS